jgi:hypothetical protein
MAFILVILTFIGGVFATQVLEYFGVDSFIRFKNKLSEIQKKKRFNRLSSIKLDKWLIDYYKQNGQSDFLYNASIGNTTQQIPFITKSNWHGVVIHNHFQLTLSDPLIKSDLKIDKNLIKRRKMFGHELWNGSLFSLNKIVEKKDSIELIIGLCDYFQYLSTSGKLEDQTLYFKSLQRKKYFTTIEQIASCSMKVHGIGMICLIAIKDQSNYKFLLQKRTHKTVSNGGKYAAIPAFAFQPINEDYQNEVEFKHQILREYYEELHDREDLILRNKHLAFDWFYNHPPIKRLISLIDNDKLEILPLGFGFDALNGEPNIAFLTIIKDEEFWREERREIVYNWEVDSIIELDYKDSSLENMLKEGSCHYGSLFALSESIKYLDVLKNNE